MDYHFNIQLSYEQLLNLALQLPLFEQEKLINTIKEKVAQQAMSSSVPISQSKNWNIHLRPKTVKEILAANYVYKPVNKKLLVGCWEGNESIETLLSLRQK
jgi:hypothetical protein